MIYLSFFWKNSYTSTLKKGDDIFFCIELIAIFTLIYSIICKLIVGRIFSVIYILVMPFLTCILSIILLLVSSAIFGLVDKESLQLYFYLHGIVAIAYILIIANISAKLKTS